MIRYRENVRIYHHVRDYFFPCFSLHVYAALELYSIASPDTLFLFIFTVDCIRDRILLGDQRLLITSSDVTLSYSRLPSFIYCDRACVTVWQFLRTEALSFSINTFNTTFKYLF